MTSLAANVIACKPPIAVREYDEKKRVAIAIANHAVPAPTTSAGPRKNNIGFSIAPHNRCRTALRAVVNTPAPLRPLSRWRAFQRK